MPARPHSAVFAAVSAVSLAVAAAAAAASPAASLASPAESHPRAVEHTEEEDTASAEQHRRSPPPSPAHSVGDSDARAAEARAAVRSSAASASPLPPLREPLDGSATPELSATSCTFHFATSHDEEEQEEAERQPQQSRTQQPQQLEPVQSSPAVHVRPLNLSPPNHPGQSDPRSRSVRSDQTPRIDYLARTPQPQPSTATRPTHTGRSRSLIQLPANADDDEQSSMEHWDGRADELMGGSKPMMLRLMTEDENDQESSASTSLSSSPSRRTKRKNQQRRHQAPSIARILDRQFTKSFPQSRSVISAAVTDPDFESETSPLTSVLRIDVSPPSTISSPIVATVETGKTEATSSDDLPRSKPWYRKKRLMIPLLCLSALILSAIISLIVLYPQAPEISTTSVTLSDMLWAVDESTGSLSANLTLTVGLQLRNNNRFGSRFEETPIDVFLTLPSGVDQRVTTMVMPSGHIGPKSELSLMITSRILDTRLSNVSEVAALAQRLRVFSDSRTKGKISMLGIQIPYVVHTQCSALCSINIFSLAVTVREQECHSSAG